MLHKQKIYKNKYVMIKNERHFLLKHAGKRYVLKDKCPHRGGPLSLGKLCDNAIKCPWHDNTIQVKVLLKKNLPAMRVHDELISLE